MQPVGLSAGTTIILSMPSFDSGGILYLNSIASPAVDIGSFPPILTVDKPTFLNCISTLGDTGPTIITFAGTFLPVGESLIISTKVSGKRLFGSVNINGAFIGKWIMGDAKSP
ncbi:hypothetical protein SDC9_179403 [bioreactor metagenome]|uniref:Uncharacterized protein n=1 Tax=bioreactor metagenome TaxID=1076179 RepID=A0A645GYW5_9ZZZZ